MAKEKAPILSVQDDVVRIDFPKWEGAFRTFFASDYAAGVTAITVLDNTNCAQNDFIILGEVGDPKTEIVKINAAVTRGTALTTTTTVFSHSYDDPVTETFYDQVCLYGSTSASDATPTAIGSAVDLDVARGFNEIQPSTTYAYYYARFYNSSTFGYSAYSTSVISTGLGRNSVRKIIERALSKSNTEMDAVEGMTKEWLIQCLNDWQDEVQLQKKKWAWLKTDNFTSPTAFTTQTQEYSLPSDIQTTDSNEAILSVRIREDDYLDYLDPLSFNRKMTGMGKTTLSANVALIDTTISVTSTGLFDDSGSITIQDDSISYTDKTSTTFTGVTGITSTHTSGDEVYQDIDDGTPAYYTITRGKILFWPIPDSTCVDDNSAFIVEYYKNVPELTEYASTTEVPFYQSAQYYLMEQIENKKGDPSKKASEYRALWRQILSEAMNKETPAQTIAFRPQKGRYPSDEMIPASSVSFVSNL